MRACSAIRSAKGANPLLAQVKLGTALLDPLLGTPVRPLLATPIHQKLMI